MFLKFVKSNFKVANDVFHERANSQFEIFCILNYTKLAKSDCLEI
jgi:hypothetical protein